MNHRRPRRGYHSRFHSPICGVLALVGVFAIAVPIDGETPAPSPPGDRFAALRQQVLDHINAARAQAGLPPYRVDPLLQRVGDQHCRDLVRDETLGHFSTSGIPPYLRYLLAGGTGFHRENASAYDTTGSIAPDEVPAILIDSVDNMLAERPPNDGHRKTLLDPVATSIGIGLAVTDWQVRMAHEVATELVEVRERPSPNSKPGEAQRFSGSLPSPWQAAGFELLWEPLPRPLTAQEAAAIRSYGYPPRRAMYMDGAVVTVDGRTLTARPSSAGSLQTGPGGSFVCRWRTGGSPGVEIAVVWARRAPGDRALEPVAAAGTVVTPDATLPAAMRPWLTLAASPAHAGAGRE